MNIDSKTSSPSLSSNVFNKSDAPQPVAVGTAEAEARAIQSRACSAYESEVDAVARARAREICGGKLPENVQMALLREQRIGEQITSLQQIGVSEQVIERLFPEIFAMKSGAAAVAIAPVFLGPAAPIAALIGASIFALQNAQR